MTDTDRSIDEFYDALQALGHPVATAEEVARVLDSTQEEADRWLDALADAGQVGRRDVERDPVVWYPVDWNQQVSREHVVAFPDRRELVVEHPEQFTRARLSQFAYLVDTSGSGGYLYRIREEDVWGAAYDGLEELLSAMRAVLGERHPGLEEWVERQWKRARQFALRTHEDGYTVLEADSASLMGNVARRLLDEDQLHAPVSDTESWVVEGSEAEIKRLLYDEGYPVRDDRDLDTGDPLEIELDLELRDYQREWVERFTKRNAGVLVGPPGSGKTVAGMGAMAAVGGETLILVPSRELAAQWCASLLANTSLGEDEIGEYHGGEKAVRPVTIATYQTAGMDRHRRLFDERRWGLIVYDECLTGDTVIETPDGKTTFTTLDEERGFDDGWNTDVDLTVRTYDTERGEYEWDAVAGVYKTIAPVQRIATNTGRELTATPGHTHLVFDPSTCEINEQRGISEGDYLIQPVSKPETGDTVLSDEERARAELVGWFIGDGHLNEHGDVKFSFSRRSDEQIAILQSLCERIDAEYSTFDNARGARTLWVPKLREELNWNGPAGDKTNTVSVPDESYVWSSERIGALLRGLFDAEGSVEPNGRIEFDTTSEQLATDVSLLLQKEGLMARRHIIESGRKNRSDIHRLYVPSFYGPRFEDRIGFRLSHKSNRLSDGESPTTGLPVGEFLRDVKADLNLTNSGLASMMDLSGSTVGGVIRGTDDLGQHHLGSLTDGLERYAIGAHKRNRSVRDRFNVTYDQLADEMGVSIGTAYRRFSAKEPTATAGIRTLANRRQQQAREYARTLGRLEGVTLLRVTDVTDVGTETVYDFETESHTFLANGLLTHNCHHIPSPVFRRSADLQSKHRLGLSVDGDTVIPVNRGGSVSMERIEDLATEYLNTEVGVAAVDDAETLSVTSDGQIKWSSIRSVMRHAHGEAMYTVRAQNGRRVTVTEDHSLMVFDTTTTEITSKRPAELSETDYLLQPAADTDLDGQLDGPDIAESPPNNGLPDVSQATDEDPFKAMNGEESTRIDVMPFLEEGYVLLQEEVPDELFETLCKQGIGSDTDRGNWKRRGSLPLDVARRIDVGDQYIKGVYIHRRDKYLPPSIPVDDFARLVGLFVADGALNDHRVEFYATDTDDRSEVERFKDLIRRLCPEADIPTVRNGENCTTVRISGPLVQVFRAIGLSNGARNKTVPEVILSTSGAYDPFIEGLIIGDGHRQDRERDRTTVTISTSSDRLAQGVNFMLSSLGYVGGNYRRTCPIGIRHGRHDVMSNDLIRFNPKNRTKQPRNAMVPFTDALRSTYASIERIAEPDRPTAELAHPLKTGLDHRSRLSAEEVSTLMRRTDTERYEWLCDTDVAFLSIDSVERSDPEEYVYDISTDERNFLGNHLFCHNSATPVRESDDEAEIFTLIGPPIGTDWSALFDAGFVVEPEVEIRYVPWGSDEAESEYASTTGHERRESAASNPAKLPEIRRLLEEHDEEKTLIFVDWLEQGRRYEEALSIPFLSGETRYARRERLLSEFRHGARETLIVSRVGDEGIDLPNASLAIVASGLGGSRRQGAQRAGRTMRPVGGARMYVLATRGTEEEEFARRQVRHLQSKGIHVMEADVDDADGDPVGEAESD